MAIAFVRASQQNGVGSATSISANIDTTGLGANGAVVVFITCGKVGGNMTGVAISTPTLGGSATGWTEIITETIVNGSTSGLVGAWVCVNPASSASIALALAYTGGSGGTANRIAAVVGQYSGVSSASAFTVDNDGTSQTTDTMTNAPSAGNLTVGAWTHGSAISSLSSGTLRGSIDNYVTDYANGCIVLGEGNTIAFTSGSSDSNVGMQIQLVAAGGAAFIAPQPLIVAAAVRRASVR